MRAALLVPGNISETMIRVSNQAWLIRANVFGEMSTALEVIFLGAILFLTLRRWSESVALIGLCKPLCLLPAESRPCLFCG